MNRITAHSEDGWIFFCVFIVWRNQTKILESLEKKKKKKTASNMHGVIVPLVLHLMCVENGSLWGIQEASN